MTQAGKLATAIGVIVLAVVVLVGGYNLGWWFQKDAANRNAHIQRSSYEQQTTYRDEMVRKIQDVHAIDVQIAQSPDAAPQLKAQRVAIVDIICRDNTHISGGLDSSTAAFVHKECA